MATPSPWTVAGSAFVTGYTGSTNFPNLNPYQTDQTGADVFVTKLSPSGSSMVYSTYLGGSDYDYGLSIAVDGSGSAYVTGSTWSTDFPTLNPYQTYRAYEDAFVTKLSPSGSSLIYSTYLGGSIDDWSYSIAVDNSGSTYVTGWTGSTNFPTFNPYQTDQIDIDVFVTKFSAFDGCCVGTTGNVDCDPGDGVDIADLTRLIDYMFVSLDPLCCAAEANCDGDPSGNVDIADLTALIDYMFVTLTPLAGCQ